MKFWESKRKTDNYFCRIGKLKPTSYKRGACWFGRTLESLRMGGSRTSKSWCGVGLHPGLIESLVGEQMDTQSAFSTQPANYPSCVGDLLLCTKSPDDAETLNKS